MKTVLQARDIELLNFLFRFKGASYPFIKKYIFPNVSKQFIHLKLKQLCLSGYIERNALPPNFKVLFVYNIKKKGLKAIGLTRINSKGVKLKSENYKHDFNLLEIISQFKRLRILDEIYTENELTIGHYCTQKDFYNSLRAVKPDSAMTLKQEDILQNATIEFEQSQKSYERYENLFKKYSRVKNLSYVFYICKNEKLMNYIIKSISSLNIDSPVEYFFALNDDIIAAKQSLSFQTIDNQFINLKFKTID